VTTPCSSQGRTLGELFGNEKPESPHAQLFVSGLRQDSRLVKQGDLFFALSGKKTNGILHVDEALRNGAIAIVVDQAWRGDTSHFPIPVIRISDLESKVSRFASRFYGNPSDRIHTIAVTGTNGKTSCCWLLSDLLTRLGEKSAYLGTLGYGVGVSKDHGISASEIIKTSLTTPDAITIQTILNSLSYSGVSTVALEASSHALAQRRIDAVSVDTAIFTNLSRDHLDYHGDMDSYGASKTLLFQKTELQTVIINADDDFSKVLDSKVASDKRIYRYSLDNNKADIFCTSISLDRLGVTANVVTPWGQGTLKSSLVGQFNLSNLLAVVAAAAKRFPLSDVLRVIPLINAPSGRMELINMESVPGVVVDYAHTPDALEKVLITLRAHSIGKLWVVFGCGGERDIGKRSKMGAIAERYTDQVVLTSDNPRGEPEDQIIAQIKRGMLGNATIKTDRRDAIRHAIFSAASDDLVVIAGKGHEDFQHLATGQLPFSDQYQVRAALLDRQDGVR
tara:strand:+ start:4017 stop:5537 length:1521 start_codon:yes stop_codon:yes gene_type:complete